MAANLNVISEMHKKALKTLERKLLFTKKGDNDVCQVYDAVVPPNGYITLDYKHPLKGKWTTCTTGRAVVMVREKTIF